MVYLTVHDLVWINNIITGIVNRYDYFALEAAMAGQYRYGDSQNAPVQAATLLERLITSAPFDSGNRRTAFIATLTFLNANGYATTASESEAARLIHDAVQGRITASEAVAGLAAPSEQPLPASLTLRKLIAHECNLHVEALQLLADDD